MQSGRHAYFHAGGRRLFWPHLPVILESEHYGGSKARGCWQDGSLYLQAVEDYHASYASIHWWPQEFLAENRELVRNINRRMGYRLQLAEASWPQTVQIGQPLDFRSTWRNAGAAPCLPGGHPAITLKDARGGIVAVLVDDGLDVRALPVADPGKAESRPHHTSFPPPLQLHAGHYDVFVSIGTPTGTPKIALPLDGDDGQRRFRLGSLQVLGDFGVRAGVPQKREHGCFLPLNWIVHHSLPDDVQPFCHLDQAGKIQLFGHPEPGAPLRSLRLAGTVEFGYSFTIPQGARSHEFSLYVGLWSPSRQGHGGHCERMQPDDDTTDRRVYLGRLRVAADGETTFIPAKS